MTSSSATTRSVIVGLLLAALFAGSLIAFSLLAGETDNPLGATVEALRTDAEVSEVVLGIRMGNTGGDSETASPETVVSSASPEAVVSSAADASSALGPSRAGDAVLGKTFRNEPQKNTSGDDKKKDGGKKGRGPKNKDSKGNDKAKGKSSTSPTAARVGASSTCRCKGKRDHAPRGHAYGYHKAPASNGSQGLARGHDKGKANGHARGHSKGKAKK